MEFHFIGGRFLFFSRFIRVNSSYFFSSYFYIDFFKKNCPLTLSFLGIRLCNFS